MAAHAIVEVAYSFLGVRRAHTLWTVLVAAVAGVDLKIATLVAGVASGGMHASQREPVGVLDRGRPPALLLVAGGALLRAASVKAILRRRVADIAAGVNVWLEQRMRKLALG